MSPDESESVAFPPPSALGLQGQAWQGEPAYNWPEVTILICTYNRLSEIQQTMAALRANLFYPQDKLRWIVCDDCSPATYLKALKKNPHFKGVDFRVTPVNSGWGVNVNNGLGAVETAYIFFIEDDYVLTRPLDLRIGVAVMEKKQMGMLRYRGTAGHHLVYHGLQADIQETLPAYREGRGVPGITQVLLLDSGSPDLYIYSHGPHLKHRRFHEFYGMYPTGLKLGETEESYAHIVKNKMKEPGAPTIGILPEWFFQEFDHIGKSYQMTEADKGESVPPSEPVG